MILKGYYLYVDDNGAYPFFTDAEKDGGVPYWMFGFEPEDAFGDDWYTVYPLTNWPTKQVMEHNAEEGDFAEEVEE